MLRLCQSWPTEQDAVQVWSLRTRGLALSQGDTLLSAAALPAAATKTLPFRPSALIASRSTVENPPPPYEADTTLAPTLGGRRKGCKG